MMKPKEKLNIRRVNPRDKKTYSGRGDSSKEVSSLEGLAVTGGGDTRLVRRGGGQGVGHLPNGGYEKKGSGQPLLSGYANNKMEYSLTPLTTYVPTTSCKSLSHSVNSPSLAAEGMLYWHPTRSYLFSQ